jgi:hypothetical protein
MLLSDWSQQGIRDLIRIERPLLPESVWKRHDFENPLASQKNTSELFSREAQIQAEKFK